MNPDHAPPDPTNPAPSALAALVREFIARLGPDAALARFLAGGPPAPGRPLTLERVREVAAGEMEPTFRMAEVVFAEYDAQPRHAPPLPPIQLSPAEPEPLPLSIQPWAMNTRAEGKPIRQPWQE